MRTAFSKPVKSILRSALNGLKPTSGFSNAWVTRDLAQLHEIHNKEKNIAICEREISELSRDIGLLLQADFQFRHVGTKSEIKQALSNAFAVDDLTQKLRIDVELLLDRLEQITSATSFSLGLFVTDTNMCSRFHSDINDLRLLCTYHGPGTLWLPEEAVNRRAHSNGDGNDEIVQRPRLIQQATTGDVLILKGVLYPDADAIIHRSPGIEQNEGKRLLLRIDTNQFADYF